MKMNSTLIAIKDQHFHTFKKELEKDSHKQYYRKRRYVIARHTAPNICLLLQYAFYMNQNICFVYPGER